jgi:tetratricopeptide (TPR) repeat protein
LLFYANTRETRWLNQSLEHFQKALALDPGSASANNGLGAAHREAGDLDLAIADWERAVAADPNFGNALYNLGTAYLDKGEKAKALTYLDKYKTLYYASLGVQDRAKLDELIRQCR